MVNPHRIKGRAHKHYCLHNEREFTSKLQQLSVKSVNFRFLVRKTRFSCFLFPYIVAIPFSIRKKNHACLSCFKISEPCRSRSELGAQPKISELLQRNQSRWQVCGCLCVAACLAAVCLTVGWTGRWGGWLVVIMSQKTPLSVATHTAPNPRATSSVQFSSVQFSAGGI